MATFVQASHFSEFSRFEDSYIRKLALCNKFLFSTSLTVCSEKTIFIRQIVL